LRKNGWQKTGGRKSTQLSVEEYNGLSDLTTISAEWEHREKQGLSCLRPSSKLENIETNGLKHMQKSRRRNQVERFRLWDIARELCLNEGLILKALGFIVLI
jgi:hypothetical protein